MWPAAACGGAATGTAAAAGAADAAADAGGRGDRMEEIPKSMEMDGDGTNIFFLSMV